jgi:hypothetical protein
MPLTLLPVAENRSFSGRYRNGRDQSANGERHAAVAAATSPRPEI